MGKTLQHVLQSSYRFKRNFRIKHWIMKPLNIIIIVVLGGEGKSLLLNKRQALEFIKQIVKGINFLFFILFSLIFLSSSEYFALLLITKLTALELLFFYLIIKICNTFSVFEIFPLLLSFVFLSLLLIFFFFAYINSYEFTTTI